MRIALAGVTGLVGHAISSGLARHGHSIVSIGRHDDDDVRIDLANPRELPRDALAGSDVLVHAAGITDEDFSDRAAAERKARGGAEALVAAAAGARVARLVYVSSAHVYGPLEGAVDEAHAVAPRSDYAAAHYATEKIFTEAAEARGAALLIARPCAIFGIPPSLERFARWSLIPFDFPRQALAGRIVLKSAGLQRRNFVSADGVATLVQWWLGMRAAGVTVANAPGPHEMTVYDFARLCARISEEETGRPCEIRRAETPPPQGAPFQYLTRVGGHLPGTDLDDHVRALVRALSKKKEGS